jgi:hypothetical protein
MGLFIWDAQPSKIFVWDTPISKVFLWDTQVRPTWWQPWANTTLYLPLNWSTKDEVSWTTYSSSNVTYTTWSWNIKCASFSWNWYINLTTTPDFEQWTWELTIMFWAMLNAVSWNRRAIALHRNSTYFMIVGISGSTPQFYLRNSQNDAWTSWSTALSTWTKYLFTLTAKENWSATMYINWVQSATKNIWTFTSSSFLFWQYVWASYDGSEGFYWTLKDVIIEKKLRTAQEISDYYNQTK